MKKRCATIGTLAAWISHLIFTGPDVSITNVLIMMSKRRADRYSSLKGEEHDQNFPEKASVNVLIFPADLPGGPNGRYGSATGTSTRCRSTAGWCTACHISRAGGASISQRAPT